MLIQRKCKWINHGKYYNRLCFPEDTEGSGEDIGPKGRQIAIGRLAGTEYSAISLQIDGADKVLSNFRLVK